MADALRAAMKLPGLSVALAFSVGIVSGLYIHLPIFWLVALFCFLFPFEWFSRGRKIFWVFFLLHLLIAGMLSIQLSQNNARSSAQSFAHNQIVSLKGRIISEPEVKMKGKRKILSFVLSAQELTELLEGRKRFIRKVTGNVQVFIFHFSQIPDVDDQVSLFGRLSNPSLILNPGQFDYRHYLAERDIYAIFTGFGKSSLRIFPTQRESINKKISQFRKFLAQRMSDLFGQPHSELAKALILGMRKGIPVSQTDEFMKTGTIHILSISGLHVTLVAGSFYLLCLILKCPQKIAAGMGIAFILLYMVIAGNGIPVQRAGMMSILAFTAILLDRENHSLNTFFWVFLILLLISPESLMQMTFQLSFLSVFCLLFVLPQWFDQFRWKDSLGQSLAILAGTFPLVIYYFNIFTPLSFLANMIAVPIFHLGLLGIFISLLLGSLPWVGNLFVLGTRFFLEMGVLWIHYLSLFPKTYFFICSPSWIQLVIYYAALGCFFGLAYLSWPQKKWFRAFCLGVAFVVAGSFFWHAYFPEFSLTLLSAGKNELAHFQSRGKNHWMINAGRGVPTNQGYWIVAPYLKKQGVNELQGVLLTDFYQKHIGGISDVVRNFKPQHLIYPDQSSFFSFKSRNPDLDSYRLKFLPVTGEESMALDSEIIFNVLGQIKGQLIFMIRYRHWQFLFLPPVNAALIDKLQSFREKLLQTDVLILSSMSGQLVLGREQELSRLFDLIDPEWVVSPHAEQVLELFLKERDIPVTALTRDGALTFKHHSEERTLQIQSFLKGDLGRLRA